MTEEQFNSAVEAQLRPDRARIAELERDRADLLVLAKSLVMVWGTKFSPQSLSIFNEIEARILSEKRHTMSIRILKCSYLSAWYKDRIGHTMPVEWFEVNRHPYQGIPEDVYWCREGGIFNAINYVLSSDAEVVP